MIVINSAGTEMVKFERASTDNAGTLYVCDITGNFAEKFEDEKKAKEALWWLFKQFKEGKQFVDMSDFAWEDL